MLRLWHIYVRRGIAYIPTTAQTEAGFFLDVEPGAVVAAAKSDLLQKAVTDAIRRGNPTVATPTRAAFPKPVVLRYADAKTWANFERDAQSWSIVEKDGVYVIMRGRRRADGRGWEDDPNGMEE